LNTNQKILAGIAAAMVGIAALAGFYATDSVGFNYLTGEKDLSEVFIWSMVFGAGTSLSLLSAWGTVTMKKAPMAESLTGLYGLGAGIALSATAYYVPETARPGAMMNVVIALGIMIPVATLLISLAQQWTAPKHVDFRF